jgi:hypothetical protein
MFDKPFISDSDPFIPGKPLHSTTELDELKRKYELSSPSQPGPRKQVADVINDEEPALVAKADPVVKTEPVAAPVPVKKKKVIITDMNTGIRKVEYR